MNSRQASSRIIATKFFCANSTRNAFLRSKLHSCGTEVNIVDNGAQREPCSLISVCVVVGGGDRTELCALPFVLLESRPHLRRRTKHLQHMIFSFVRITTRILKSKCSHINFWLTSGKSLWIILAWLYENVLSFGFGRPTFLLIPYFSGATRCVASFGTTRERTYAQVEKRFFFLPHCVKDFRR